MCLFKKSLLLPLTFCFILFSISPSTAKTSLGIPPQYGQVIYQLNEKSPNQLFIIALGHRDTVTCLNGDNTSRIQAEVYKIGDWLIHNQGLGLLLPEGFFKSASAKVNATGTLSSCTRLDMKALEEKLSDNTAYVNAEMLLKETHPLRLRQVEDKELYNAVRDNLLKLLSCGEDSSDSFLLKSKLDYLQEKRTAAMLQKIPGIVDDEFQRGNIKTRKAILTIGLSHLPEIIRYLNGNRITIHAPLPAPNGKEDYNSEVNLLKEHFGVSVILPTTLAGDQKILRITGLDGIIRQCQSHP